MLQRWSLALRQEGTNDLNRTMGKRREPWLITSAMSHRHHVREMHVFSMIDRASKVLADDHPSAKAGMASSL